MNEEEIKRTRGLSLQAKNTLIFVALLVLMIAALWLINHFYLQRYYLRKQLVSLEDTRLMLEELIRNPDSEELQLQLTRQCESSGIGATLIKTDALGMPLLLFGTEGDRGPWRLWQEEIRRSEQAPPAKTVYKETESYKIIQVTDPVTHTEKIECLGRLAEKDEEYVYLLTLPLARIAESAELSNRFLLIIGAGVLVLGVVLVSLFSRRLAGPIAALTRLSQKMARLDFSERFEGQSGDEVQILGENINHLSDTLETTIADLREANNTLERDVREKEKENERRQELLANISHELKTPIALIQGYAEGLRDGMCEDEETRTRYSDIILDEANRMNRLVRQLLSLNEMESGAMTVNKSEFDLAELIREMAEAFQINKKTDEVRLELLLPEHLPVFSDELLVEQILQNYLSNAYHHVKKGGLIRIAAFSKEDGAQVEVFNEGDPIPQEALDQIWQKFFKVDKARTRDYGGSGIGLSVVKAATDILGGSCQVENRPGGVCFMVRI